MARCSHNNVQQFTEMCLDCGHNIYESDEEYKKSLERDISNLRSKLREKRIEQLEDEKEKLQKELRDEEDDNGGYNGNF